LINRTYSDEELEQIFQNLVLERQKTKELEQKLLILNQEQAASENISSSKPTTSKEIDQLRYMINLYKKKNTQAILTLYEQEQNPIPSHQVRELYEQIEDLKEENASLIEQQKNLKNRYDQVCTELKSVQLSVTQDHSLKSHEWTARYQEVVSQNSKQKEQLEKLAGSLQDREKKIRDLQKFEYSYKKNSENRFLLETQVEQERNSNKTLRLENQKLYKNLTESQKHSDQLERVLKHLRERSEESHLELNQLREDFQRSQEATTHLSQQLKMTQSRLHDQTQEYQQVQTEKNDTLEEMQALQSQFSGLRTQVLDSQRIIQDLQGEKSLLEKRLTGATTLIEYLRKEWISVKEVLSKGLFEAQDLQQSYLGLVHDKTTYFNQSKQLKEHLERQKIEIIDLQSQLKVAFEKEGHLKASFEDFEKIWHEKHQQSLQTLQQKNLELENTLQKYQEDLSQKDEQISELHHQLSTLRQDKIHLEDTLTNITRYQDEQEARIKVAQQHLGKKVKEVALLNEKIEEQKVQISDLQSTINQLKLKMSEAQAAFEQQLFQEKKQHDQLHETVRFAEGQVAKWEEKYLKAYEKLKTLEEKQQQMHSLFSSLGHVMSGSPISTASSPQAPSSPTAPDTPTANFSTTKEEIYPLNESPFSQPAPSLFNLEQKPSPMRQNLFD